MGFAFRVNGFGSKAKRGSPLAVSVAFNGADIVENAGPATQTIDSGAGQIDLTATATGGTAPYSYSWSVLETSDNGNNSILSLGTTNAAIYNTLQIRTVLPAISDPPTEAQYLITCQVTDSATDTVSGAETVTVVGIPL